MRVVHGNEVFGVDVDAVDSRQLGQYGPKGIILDLQDERRPSTERTQKSMQLLRELKNWDPRERVRVIVKTKFGVDVLPDQANISLESDNAFDVWCAILKKWVT